MTENRNTAAQTTTQHTAPTVRKQINGTTYIVRVHFNENARETMEDKIKRLLRNEKKSLTFRLWQNGQVDSYFLRCPARTLRYSGSPGCHHVR